MFRFALACSVVAAALAAVPSWKTQAQNAPRTAKPFIVGGTPVEIADFPYQASLKITIGSTQKLCGGTVIRANWVLTAAHCFADANKVVHADAAVQIYTGNKRLYAGYSQPSVQVFVHESYVHDSHVNDIALVQLRDRLTDLEPVQLVGASDTSPPQGTNLTVIGWGRTSENGSRSDVLLKATVPYVPNATCNKPESYDGRVTNGMICAGFAAGGIDHCNGDSGGPLLDTRSGTRQIGIVSWATGCARPNKYGVYTNVRSYLSWIEAKLNSVPDPEPFDSSCYPNDGRNRSPYIECPD